MNSLWWILGWPISFSATSPNTKLLIVGDADQLPSVSPGQVLSDPPHRSQSFLKSNWNTSSVKVKGSTIVTLASQIRKRPPAPDFTEKNTDRSLL